MHFLTNADSILVPGKGVSLPQHVWDNEKSHMTSTNVNLVEMADTSVTRGNGDVFELNVHVVLRYRTHIGQPLVLRSATVQAGMMLLAEQKYSLTFKQLATVHLTRGDL